MTALVEADTIAREGDTLTLTGEDVELHFREAPPPPTAKLLGQTWQLESLIQGRGESEVVRSAHPASLKLSGDGSFTGSTGCRGLSGEWIESLDEIVFTTFAANGNCPRDLVAQDNHVGGVLGDGFTASIEGSELTVFASRGDFGLLYRASRTGGTSSAEAILKAAPRTDCPALLIRADAIKPSQLGKTMRGHIPNWLPQDFGLHHSFGAGDGILGGAAWHDNRCREVLLIFWASLDDQFEGPRVGRWTLTVDAPGECGNNILGMSRCLTYHAAVSGGTLGLQMVGLERSDGDRIAESISN